MRTIYLDGNASTPVAPEVRRAIIPLLTDDAYGNPSSHHWAAGPARQALATARAEVARLLGCEPSEVVFTSGGSEANNLAIKGAVLAAEAREPHVVTTRVEHPSVLEPCRALERRGVQVTYLPVDGTGRVDPEEVRRAITADTVLVSVMWANNEVGTVQPVAEIAEITRQHGVLFHSDAAQAAGKIDLTPVAAAVDLLTVAGHKLYAPKGVGALRIREGVQLEPLIHGGGQERGVRGGTEAAFLAVGLGAACRLAIEDPAGERMRALRDLFWSQLSERLGDRVRLNGHPTERLPNTLNVSVRGWEGAALLDRLPGVAASTGSACHSGRQETSPVLAAMGLPAERARGAVRFSLCRSTTEQEIRRVAQRLVAEAGER
jgi:cysteine desulfurase